MGWLFVHVPKTGGTSVRNALRESFGAGYFGAAVSRNAHAPARLHESALGAGWSEVLAFACVRDPFDRLVSAWAWARRFGGLHSERFAEWVAEGCPLHPRMRVHRGRGESLWLTDPQVCWLMDAGGAISVEILRFERLEEDWRRIASRIGAKPDLGHANSSKRVRDLGRYYDKATRRRVVERYARDFEALGYAEA